MLLSLFCLNVRYCQGQDGRYRWANRLPRIVELIRSHDPTFLTLQEVLPHQRADLEQALPEFQWFGLGRHQDFSGEQCPVGLRAEIPVLGDTNLWLSPHPDQPGSRGWDACLPRIATAVWAQVEGRRMVIASTHFDHLGQVARLESARLLQQILEEPATLVGGDFNTGPESEPIRWLSGQWTNATREKHGDKRLRTFHDFGRDRNCPQIDYIFCGPVFQVESCEVLNEPGPDFCSDHFPLIASFRL